MSVSCMLVLGEKAKGLVDDRTTEHWFSSYIGKYGFSRASCTPDLLSRSLESLQVVECDSFGHQAVSLGYNQ